MRLNPTKVGGFQRMEIRKEKDKTIFIDMCREIEVDNNGLMRIKNTYTDQEVLFLESIPLLEKALKKSKEIIDKKKEVSLLSSQD